MMFAVKMNLSTRGGEGGGRGACDLNCFEVFQFWVSSTKNGVKVMSCIPPTFGNCDLRIVHTARTCLSFSHLLSVIISLSFSFKFKSGKHFSVVLISGRVLRSIKSSHSCFEEPGIQIFTFLHGFAGESKFKRFILFL